MPLRQGTRQLQRSFALPLSYRINDNRNIYRDCKNVFINQDRLATRFGTSRYNAVSLGGAILSLSYFEKSDGTKYTLAKVGDTLYSVSTTGSHTSIKTGLSDDTKHRGITLNNRHIVAIESDGLFQWDGTNFTQLGQSGPSAPTVAVSGSGNSITASTYQVANTLYSSTTGFETNIGAASSTVTITGTGEQIDVTGIQATAANATIDKVRVYLKDVGNNGAWLFISEINLGTTTATIADNSDSTQIPPTTHAAPLSGGGKYFTKYGRKLAYSGNGTFPNDVYISEEDLPDAFDDTLAGISPIPVAGDGPIIGIATGFYSDSNLDPFLCIFKETSISIFSEIGGNARFQTISDQIGCVSHDSIIEKNGAIFFLSSNGWRAIVDGRMIRDDGDPITLGNGAIDDIFRSPGFVYEINRSQLSNTFSVYYSELDQYWTWIAEGSNNSFFKAYVYEFGGKNRSEFKRFDFVVPAQCSVVAKKSNGKENVLFGDAQGYIIQHSTDEARTDIDNDSNTVSIDAFAVMNWVDGDDIGTSYNFRELIIKAINSSNDVTVKAWVDYDLADVINYTYSFPNPQSGFVLDLSKLDEGVFGDDRAIVFGDQDLCRSGRNLLIGFYQNISGASMELISYQLEFNRNGCNN